MDSEKKASVIPRRGVRGGTVGAARMALFVLVLAGTGARPAWTQGPFSPVEAVIVNSSDVPVPVDVVPKGVPFTLPPKQVHVVLSGAAVAPDPSGTSYAITSFTVSNPSTAPSRVLLRAVAFEVGGADCLVPANEVESTDGPEVSIPAHDTVHVVFPQPFVTTPVAGPFVCLVAGADGAFTDVKWSVVGYKILP